MVASLVTWSSSSVLSHLFRHCRKVRTSLASFHVHPCPLLHSSLLAQQECPSSVSDQMTFYKDHGTSEEVRAKIQQAIGPHDDLLTIVKRRNLKWYGHVSRSSGLAKTILQGTMKGGRRQSRQKNTREDNVREWTGPEFAKSHRPVKNS